MNRAEIVIGIRKLTAGASLKDAGAALAFEMARFWVISHTSEKEALASMETTLFADLQQAIKLLWPRKDEFMETVIMQDETGNN